MKKYAIIEKNRGGVSMKKFFKTFLKFAPVLLIAFFIFLEFLSRSAAGIFNHVIAEQKTMNGTVTVEKISANIFGKVSFENLIWKDFRGNIIAQIPQGNFTVRLYDVITRNFKTTTIQDIFLQDANISLRLNEKMQIEFVGQSQDLKQVNKESWEKKVSQVHKSEEELKRLGEQRRKLQQERIESGWKNFNLEGQKIKLNMRLENCKIEVFYRQRHYLFSGVKFDTKINTDDEMTLQVHTGIFGGTMIGRGMKMNGKIDFKPEIPTCDLSILLQEVDPSSLGFGLNIHDEMTLLAHFSGEISRPVGDGLVKMKELHIPGLDFKNVSGDILYEDSMLKFSNVTAEVYGGDLFATGDYNFDTRYYNIYGEGKKLKTYYALPKSHLHCDVNLNIAINSKGNAKETSTSGDFSSSKGRYSFLKIDNISGKFKTEYNSINFYDVALKVGNYNISTDALSIIDKKLHLSPIAVTDENGNLIKTF